MTADHVQVLVARLQLPRWLSWKAWGLSVDKAISGWQTHVRIFNVVPYPSGVHDYAHAGDMAGLSSEAPFQRRTSVALRS